ncbi:hypothetical protein TNCV_3438691 [Trichonephila clavipes]|nr:hypothetical protein TNCV_3438691 [Trichonephila clavipes]
MGLPTLRVTLNVGYCCDNTVYGLGSPVVKVKDSCPACHEFEPSTVEDTPCRGERCTLNLSTAQTSSRWCGVVVRREGASSGVVYVT